MRIAISGSTFALLAILYSVCQTAENDKYSHPLNGVWIPNAAVNEALGVSEKKQWPYGFDIRLSDDDHAEAIGSKEDIETLLIVTAQHQGVISARGTFAFLNADGTRSKTHDCVLTEKAGGNFLSVPAPYQAPVFTKVTFVKGADRHHDIVFFAWPPEADPKAATMSRTTVGFSRKKQQTD